MSRFAVALLFSLCVLFAATVSATVPEGMAVTPNGLLPKSCVHGPISLEHTVVNMGSHSELIDAKGNTIRTIDPCVQPNPNQLPPSGWAAYVYDQGSQPSITSYNGTWTVPPMPKDAGAQTLFLFTGLQDNFGLNRDIPSVVNIIQPVLQFGPSEAGGGQYWAMASWYVDSVGNAYYSTLTRTSSGNVIQGNMYMNPTNGVWAISTIDMTGGHSTQLNIAPNTTEPWAFVTLEVYTVSNCAEYPTGSVPFTNLVFAPPQTPSWNVQVSPGCDENVQVNGPTSVTIDF